MLHVRHRARTASRLPYRRTHERPSLEKRTMHRFMAVASLVMAIATPRVALAQVDRATRTGTVTDTAGAVVPGATVSITNSSTNVSSQQVSTDTGSYQFVNLIPGPYVLTVELAGFKKSSHAVTL